MFYVCARILAYPDYRRRLGFCRFSRRYRDSAYSGRLCAHCLRRRRLECIIVRFDRRFFCCVCGRATASASASKRPEQKRALSCTNTQRVVVGTFALARLSARFASILNKTRTSEREPPPPPQLQRSTRLAFVCLGTSSIDYSLVIRMQRGVRICKLRAPLSHCTLTRTWQNFCR